MPQLWFFNNDKKFVKCDDDILIQVLDCIERLKTHQQEQSFFTNNGIDYVGVANGTASLEQQIYDITNLYTQYFTTTINKTETEGKRVYIDITFTLKNTNENIDYQIIEEI